MTEIIVITLAAFVVGWPAAIIGLSLVRQAGNVAKQLAIDTIEIYARASQAKSDAEKRWAELEYWQDQAQVKLREQRQGLLGEVSGDR